MASTERAASINDLRALAKRRMPRFAFDFVDGGAENERNLNRNVDAFGEIELVPRYLIDVSKPVTETEILGQSYAVPFGMAPVGFLNMAWPGADLMTARLAAEKRMPLVISTASSTPLEEVAEAAGGNAWFQMYVSDNTDLTNQLLRRAQAAGCRNLVITIDVVQPGKRDRDIRNGLQVPFKLSPRIIADLLLHPAWSWGTFRAGPPGFANFSLDGSQSSKPVTLAQTQKSLISNRFGWPDLARIRDAWKGSLLLKGILHPEDAVMAVEAGCDGVIVSNHGGRQLDYGPSAIEALPAVVAAVDHKIPVMIDSGIRRGSDIVRARALGASFIFAGRPFAYGVAAGGDQGCRKAFEILETELVRALGQLGCPEFAKAGRQLLRQAPPQ